ncbi:DEAD/H-box helicase 11 [Homo sapiens]|uniref:DEAD/H-box helicase 11 n=2 Tax=Homininae TaxID=207598 RepID=F5H2V9_HUMAN|nr:DEAD/H-box helicase 11 [Homo sapiens]KAI4065280.1 DEAD/H-box helicase 11 [Homo sapiens]
MANETQKVGAIHFPFPFTPYSIQEDFMAELYRVLEAGKIGIFESPTGTGLQAPRGLLENRPGLLSLCRRKKRGTWWTD